MIKYFKKTALAGLMMPLLLSSMVIAAGEPPAKKRQRVIVRLPNPYVPVFVNDDILQRIMSMLPLDGCRNLSCVCKQLRTRIMTTPALLASFIAQKLIDTYIDPITYVLHMAEGKPEVKLYGFTLNTATIINILKRQNCKIHKSIDKITEPWWERFYYMEALTIPKGITLTKQQQAICNKYQEISLQGNSLQEIVEEIKKAQDENPQSLLKIDMLDRKITPELCQALANFPIISISLINCQCEDFEAKEIFDQLKSLDLLQELRLRNVTFGSNREIFPKELCALEQLTLLDLKSQESIQIPAEIGSMPNLNMLILEAYGDIDFPQTSTPLQHCPQFIYTRARKTSLGNINPKVFCSQGFITGSFEHMDNLIVLGGSDIPADQLKNLKNLRKIVFLNDDRGFFDLTSKKNMADVIEACVQLKNVEHLNLTSVDWSLYRNLFEKLLKADHIKTINLDNVAIPRRQLKEFIQLGNFIADNQQFINKIKGLIVSLPTETIKDFLVHHSKLAEALQTFQQEISLYLNMAQIWKKRVINHKAISELASFSDNPQKSLDMFHYLKNNPKEIEEFEALASTAREEKDTKLIPFCHIKNPDESQVKSLRDIWYLKCDNIDFNLLHQLQQLRGLILEKPILKTKNRLFQVISQMTNLEHLEITIKTITWKQLEAFVNMPKLNQFIIGGYNNFDRLKSYVKLRNLVSSQDDLIKDIIWFTSFLNNENIKNFLTAHTELNEAFSIIHNELKKHDIFPLLLSTHNIRSEFLIKLLKSEIDCNLLYNAILTLQSQRKSFSQLKNLIYVEYAQFCQHYIVEEALKPSALSLERPKAIRAEDFPDLYSCIMHLRNQFQSPSLVNMGSIIINRLKMMQVSQHIDQFFESLLSDCVTNKSSDIPATAAGAFTPGKKILTEFLNRKYAQTIMNANTSEIRNILSYGVDPNTFDTYDFIIKAIKSGRQNWQTQKVIEVLQLIHGAGANPFNKVDGNYELENICNLLSPQQPYDALLSFAGNTGILHDSIELFKTLKEQQKQLNNLVPFVQQAQEHALQCPEHIDIYNHACNLIQTLNANLTVQLDNQHVLSCEQSAPSLKVLELLANHKDHLAASTAESSALIGKLHETCNKLQQKTPECLSYIAGTI